MKKSIWGLKVSAFLVLAAFVSACGDSGGGGGGGGTTVAVAPNQCNLPQNQNPYNGFNGTNCNPNQYNQNGWQSYPGWDYGTNNGLCSCPVGMRPVAHPSLGIGCAPVNQFNWGGGSNYIGWGFYGSAGYNWNGIPQVAGRPWGQNCFSDAARACDLRSSNSCGANAYCQPTGGGSTIGLCVSNIGSQGGTNNCSYRWTSWGYVWTCSTGWSHGSYNGFGWYPGWGYSPYGNTGDR